MQAGEPIKRPKAKLARVLGWMGEHVAGTVLGFAVTAALTAGVVWVTGKDQTSGQEIDQVREEIASSGHVIRGFEKVDLHAGATSYLFAIAERNEFAPVELRIYDAEGDTFRKRFAFAPEMVSANQDVIVTPESFAVLANRDATRDGQPELIGSYVLESATALLELPIVIAWDSAAEEYLLRPLLDEPPDPLPGETDAARGVLAPFQAPYVVSDGERNRFKAWAAESLALLEIPLFAAREGQLYMGAAFPAPSETYSQAFEGKRLQIAYWAVAASLEGAAPEAYRLCWNNDVRLLEEEVQIGEELPDVIERGWQELVRADERSRRGEDRSDPLYVGSVLDENCVLGE